MKVSKTELLRIFSDLRRKPLTDSMFQTLIDSLWRDDIKPKIISFTNSDTPSIANYNTKYAPVFGQFPTVKLYTTDGDGNRIERSELPYFILDVDGLIDTISFGTLADGPQTGYIKLQ